MAETTPPPPLRCRCGHDGNGPHPCHGGGFACAKPATERFYATTASIAGVQMKVGAAQTWACDECWEWYRQKLAKRGAL